MVKSSIVGVLGAQWKPTGLTLQGQEANSTLPKEDSPSSTTLQLPWDPWGKWLGVFKKWFSICKSFIFLGANTNLASLAKYSSFILIRSTYSASFSGVGSPFSATSLWRSSSFMGITVQLFSPLLFPKSLAELKTPLKFFENYSSK